LPKDLVFEIGTEEMPAAAVDLGIKQLKDNAEKLLTENRLSYGEIETMGTPRRLVLLVSELAEKQDEFVREVKGPAKKVAYSDAGEPTVAAVGFARSQGVDVSELVIKDVEQREYVFALVREKGRLAVQVLSSLLPGLLLSISFKKAMRWNTDDIQFVRPIRWILALFGDSIVRFSVSDLQSDNLTWGHRFLATNPIKVETTGQYMSAIESGKVIVDHIRRAKNIGDQIEAAVKESGGTAVIHPQTFNEVVNLVEFPHAICGSFSRDYVTIPRDVLVTAMESHQRYFPVESKDGSLLPYFVVVHNGDSNHNEIIRRGHERVLRARLADAKFFFEEDQKEPLAGKVEKLKGVVFQAKLGTVFDKVERVKELAGLIAQELSAEESVLTDAKRAAYLSKADLVTEMVVEFPTLQGVMGREYALLSGEKETVARAIFEHYLPRSADDILPESIGGKILSIADKIDSIVGCFSVGLLPTGSEDPYSLRRQAQGIINIILENEFRLSLSGLFASSYNLYKKAGLDLRSEDEIKTDLEDFFRGRLRNQFLNEGFSFDIVDAVLACDAGAASDLRERIASVARFRETPQIDDLLTAFNRCNNLAKLGLGTDVSRTLLQEKEEKELFELIQKVAPLVEGNVADKRYGEAMSNLASLRPVVDKLFDEVLIMAEDERIRENRLILLNRCVKYFLKVADFSKLVVPGS